jgi:hypothetical protein
MRTRAVETFSSLLTGVSPSSSLWLMSTSYLRLSSYVTPTVSRPVCPGVKPHLGPKTTFSLLSDSYQFVNLGRYFWIKDGSLVYNCCWPSPAQLFSGPGPPGLTTIFYCLRFETPETWKARYLYLYPLGTGWPSYIPRHWVPFSSPPTTRRATVEVFDSASTRMAQLSYSYRYWYTREQNG